MLIATKPEPSGALDSRVESEPVSCCWAVACGERMALPPNEWSFTPMSDFQDHFPDAEAMLALEPEELAGYLLQFYHSIPDGARRRTVMTLEWLDSSGGRIDDKYDA